MGENKDEKEKYMKNPFIKVKFIKVHQSKIHKSFIMWNQCFCISKGGSRSFSYQAWIAAGLKK